MPHIWRTWNKLPIVGSHFIPFLYTLHYCCLINCLLFSNHRLWEGQRPQRGLKAFYVSGPVKLVKVDQFRQTRLIICSSFVSLHLKSCCVAYIYFRVSLILGLTLAIKGRELFVETTESLQPCWQLSEAVLRQDTVGPSYLILHEICRNYCQFKGLKVSG